MCGRGGLWIVWLPPEGCQRDDNSVTIADQRRHRGSTTRSLFGDPVVTGNRRPYSIGVSRLVNSIPVYDVTIPWGPPFADDIAPQLAALSTAS